MIQDMIKNYKMELKKGPGIILDNYRPKDGLYVRFNVESPPVITDDNYIIIYNKKDKEQPIPIDDMRKLSLFKWFKEMDLYSVILNDDTNKAVDLPAKKIHSTNWMTLFIKKDIFPGIGKNPIDKQVLLKLMDKYFDKIENAEDKLAEIYKNSKYVSNAKNEDKEEFLQGYFSHLIGYIRKGDRKRAIHIYKKYVLDNFDGITKSLKEFSMINEVDGYIKVFFDVDLEIYRMENEIYTVPRIFNVNDYNIFRNAEIFGLPSTNVTTNSKKPYLILKTMQTEVPNRINTGDAYAAKSFFDWLVKQGKFVETKIQYDYNFKSGIDSFVNSDSYFSVHLNQNAEIDDFDNVSVKISDIDLSVENILGVKERMDPEDRSSELVEIKPDAINKRYMLRKRFLELFFNNDFRDVYLKDHEPDVRPSAFTPRMKALFMMSRDAMHDSFSKGIDISLKAMLDKLTLELIEERLLHTTTNSRLTDIAKAFNMRICLLKYFNLGGDQMADIIKQTMEGIKQKINSEEVAACSNNEEFYFTCGQISYYLLSRSGAKNKKGDLFEPILRAKNSIQLKKRIEEIYQTYKHAVPFKWNVFNNAMSMIMGYMIDKKIEDVDKQILLAGLLSNNLIKKNEEEIKK